MQGSVIYIETIYFTLVAKYALYTEMWEHRETQLNNLHCA